MLKNKSAFTKFLIWRYKHISNNNFIYILAIVIGLLAGLASVVLKNATHFIASLFEQGSLQNYHHLFYFLFPSVGLLLVFFISKYILKTGVGHGIPMALFSISQKEGKMERRNIISSLLTAPITVGFGGSVGLEGPSVATGASVGSNIAKLFHMNPQTRKLLLVCAAAGSLSAIFKAPIAAILFAVEVFSLDLTFASLVPLLLASISAVITRMFFIGEQYIVNFSNIDAFKISDLAFYALLGVLTAVVSIYFSKVYFAIERQFSKFKNQLLKVGLAGVILGVLTFAVPPLYGEGFGFMNNLIAQDHELAFSGFYFQEWLGNNWTIIGLVLGLILLKPIATAVTLSGGGVGGVFAPVLFLGAVTGSFFVNLSNSLGFNLSNSNFTMVGMAGLMAGVLHAPLTAMFLIAEITGGYQLFVPLMISVAISFLISRSQLSYNIYTKELKESDKLITQDKDKAVLTLLKLDQIIETNFISLKPKMTLKKMLLQGVAKSKRNLFPVLDDEGILVGVITLDDVREIMFDTSLYDSVLVEFLMHDPPEYIYYGKDNMQRVMNKFQNTSAWNLPVIKEGKYVGFVSKSKMLTAYRRKLISY
ncbi:chloride channel protein [Haloflavibacter putidus]|uniref:Chloride channel protein n=1 Tax=Haloflavibacter putidus TaxID=2576776 RepID=A0A507ZVF0_9FLAO|nr:chloride channel protein [Haloflavibacter putidus]TQD40433.1 chloride channel protein [Haloflavibacter putidus]